LLELFTPAQSAARSSAPYIVYAGLAGPFKWKARKCSWRRLAWFVPENGRTETFNAFYIFLLAVADSGSTVRFQFLH
jgi:hypothetical protein